MKLVVKQNTVFKQYTIDSAKLAPKDKAPIAAGRSFEIHSWKPAGPLHWKVALINQFVGDPPRNTWYVFAPHVQLIDSQGATPPLDVKPAPIPTIPAPTPTIPAPTPISIRIPDGKLLGVPYHCQLNNAENPRGACNVTCFAMVMDYFKIPRKTNAMQLEDELYRYMDNNGLSRHEPNDLRKMAEAYGLRNEMTLRGSATDIRRAIAEGKPCIIHGYFTSFGHIVTLIGYDKDGFIVNDPFGEWTADGYIQGPYGDGLSYSNGLIQRTCSPEGSDHMWLHRLSKK
jgi:Peptidase_C39 like family